MNEKDEELKTQIIKWGNQVGVYCEGCMCDVCVSKIEMKIREAFSKYRESKGAPHYNNISNEEILSKFGLATSDAMRNDYGNLIGVVDIISECRKQWQH